MQLEIEAIEQVESYGEYIEAMKVQTCCIPQGALMPTIISKGSKKVRLLIYNKALTCLVTACNVISNR